MKKLFLMVVVLNFAVVPYAVRAAETARAAELEAGETEKQVADKPAKADKKAKAEKESKPAKTEKTAKAEDGKESEKTEKSEKTVKAEEKPSKAAAAKTEEKDKSAPSDEDARDETSAGVISKSAIEAPVFQDKIPLEAPKSEAVEGRDLLSEAKTDTSFPWVRSAVSFLFIASLIIVGGMAARKFYSGKGKAFGFLRETESRLSVLQTVSLGLKRQLMIVDFDGTEILLGTTGSQMQLLCVKNESKPAPAAAVTAAQTAEEASFEEEAATEEISPKLADQILRAVRDLKPLAGSLTDKKVH